MYGSIPTIERQQPPGRAWLWPMLLMLVFAAFSAHRWNSPPLDTHSWRQGLAASVAKNFGCGQKASLPRVDNCGDGPYDGVVAMEFPGYAYLGSMVGKLLGSLHHGLRFVMLGGVLAGLLGLSMLLSQILGRFGAGPARAAGALGASLVLVSPLARFWMETFVPDGVAWGLGLLGLALIGRSGDSGVRRLVVGSLLLSVGLATKLIALPLVVASVPLAYVVHRREGLLCRHGAKAVGIHLLATAALPAFWYLFWNRHLGTVGHCSIFALTTPEGVPLLTLLRDPTTPALAWTRIHDLAGPYLWPLAAGLVVLPFALRWTSLIFLAELAGSYVVFAVLGWHTRVHEYDGLVFLLPAATCLASLGVVVARFFRGRWLVTAIGLVAVGFAARATTADALRRERFEDPVHLFIGRDLDRVLQPGEAMLATNRAADPRVAYYAARRVLSPEQDRVLCEPGELALDCAYFGVPLAQPCAPGRGRWATGVYWPSHTLLCGIKEGSAARGRLERRLQQTVLAASNAVAPGIGRFIGFDARPTAAGAVVDLYFRRESAAGAPPPAILVISESAAGRQMVRAFPPQPWQAWPEGALVVYRASGLLKPGQATISFASESGQPLSLPRLSVDLPAAEEPPWAERCAGPPSP